MEIGLARLLASLEIISMCIMAFIVIIILWTVLTINRNRGRHQNTKKVTVIIEDPILVEKINLMYEQQDSIALDISQKKKAMQYLQEDRDKLLAEIKIQEAQLEYTLKTMPTSDPSMINELYHEKIHELSRKMNNIDGKINKLQQQMIGLMDKSNDICKNVNKIAEDQYRINHQ